MYNKRVRIIPCKDEFKVFTVWDSYFQKKARQLGGEWKNNCWIFENYKFDDVKRNLEYIYGENGIDEVERINIEIIIDRDVSISSIAIGYNDFRNPTNWFVSDGISRIEYAGYYSYGDDTLEIEKDEFTDMVRIVYYNVPKIKLGDFKNNLDKDGWVINILSTDCNTPFKNRNEIFNRIKILNEEIVALEKLSNDYGKKEVVIDEFIDED